MKRIFKKLRVLDNRIGECRTETEAVKRLPFYSIFKQESRRKKDLELLKTQMDEFLLKKFILLEELKDEISAEQSNIINYQTT